jgi:hypothetical protein
VSAAAGVSSLLTFSGGSLTRVASAAAYPLLSALSGLGSVALGTTAMALGTSLSVLRLGLGVVKFMVQVRVWS